MSGIRVIGVNGDNEFEKFRELLTPIREHRGKGSAYKPD